MRKRALVALAAASAASLVLLAAPSASAYAVTNTAGPHDTAAAAPSVGTMVVTDQALAADAIAGPHYWMYTDDDNPGGRIDFWPNGDVVELCDTQADGYSVHADLGPNSGSGFVGYSLSVGGNGKCVIARASQGGTRDLPEEACIAVFIFLNKSGGSPQFTDSAAWINDNDVKANC
jgi:hypothetical protein